MEIILPWIILSAVAGHIAHKKGRSDLGFFLLSMLITPVVGIICALVASPNEAVMDKRKLKTGTVKRCPYCAEMIKTKAITCRYCGKDLPAL